MLAARGRPLHRQYSLVPSVEGSQRNFALQLFFFSLRQNFFPGILQVIAGAFSDRQERTDTRND